MCTPLGLEEICSSAKLTRLLAWIHPLRMCEASASALFRPYSGLKAGVKNLSLLEAAAHLLL